VLRRALENRLRPATAPPQAIGAGDLSRRVPLSGRDDEFDRLGATHERHARPHRAADGGRARRLGRDRARPAHADRARARQARGSAAFRRDDEEALRAAMEQGIADLDHIARVFQAVLRIAEAEAGARRAAFAPLDLAPMLADIAEFYGAVAEARDQHLLDRPAGALPLVGDRDLLAAGGGEPARQRAEVHPGWRRGAARDRGAAAARARRHRDRGRRRRARACRRRPRRAGERFFRADAARGTPGSGLGLSLVRAVRALHGCRSARFAESDAVAAPRLLTRAAAIALPCNARRCRGGEDVAADRGDCAGARAVRALARGAVEPARI
jgi:hypothetical protein